MKLTIAFGILTQTSPAFSDQSVGSFQLGRSFARIPSSFRPQTSVRTRLPHVGLKRSRLSSIIKEKKADNLELENDAGLSGKRQCDPSSTDPDIGVFSCGITAYCKHNQGYPMGGVCTPLRKSSNKKFGSGNFHVGTFRKGFRKLECSPSSSADVGILACKEGQQCVESAHSSLGGFCDSITNRRNLSPLTDGAAICDPTSDFFMYYDCDCSGFDADIGTGIVPCTAVENYCLGLTYNGCRGACVTRTMEYTFQNFNAPSYSWCYATTTPYAQEVCFSQFVDNSTCQVALDGAKCSSCTVSGNYSEIAFDCTNVGGGKGTGISDALPVVAACFQPIANETECRLCPETGTAFNPFFYNVQVNITGYGTYGCSLVASNAYYSRSISQTVCPTISAATKSLCCSKVCFLCDPYSYIPYANGGINLSSAIQGFNGKTCGDLASAAYQSMNLSESVCALAAGTVQTCCEALTAPPVTTNPAGAPTTAPFPASNGPLPTVDPIVNTTTSPTVMPSPIATTAPTTRAPVFTANISATSPPSISITSTLSPFPSNSPTNSPVDLTTNAPFSPTNGPVTEPNNSSGADQSTIIFSGIRLLSLAGIATIASSLLLM